MLRLKLLQQEGSSQETILDKGKTNKKIEVINVDSDKNEDAGITNIVHVKDTTVDSS